MSPWKEVLTVIAAPLRSYDQRHSAARKQTNETIRSHPVERAAQSETTPDKRHAHLGPTTARVNYREIFTLAWPRKVIDGISAGFAGSPTSECCGISVKRSMIIGAVRRKLTGSVVDYGRHAVLPVCVQVMRARDFKLCKNQMITTQLFCAEPYKYVFRQLSACKWSNREFRSFSAAVKSGAPQFAASEIAADEIAAKNRPPCKGPPI